METDRDRSLERLAGTEDTRAKVTGFGTTNKVRRLSVSIGNN